MARAFLAGVRDFKTLTRLDQHRGGVAHRMKTVRGVLAVAAAIVVIGLGWTAAMAVDFNVEVSVGWINTTGTCTSGTTCLGFNGTGGFTGTSLILNWDNGTTSGDSFLRVGALPDTAGFPVGSASTTIDPGQTVRTAEVQ